MRYTIRKSIVQVVGKIWQPGMTCAMEYTIPLVDVQAMERDESGKPTRDAVSDWVDSHSGDFSSIKGFSASLEIGDETVEYPWESEEVEYLYLDCMLPYDEADA